MKNINWKYSLLILFYSLTRSLAISQDSQGMQGENYLSLHIGELLYLSYSMNLFKNRGIRFITGFGTPDLIGFQDYSKKYNESNHYRFFRRNCIFFNNSYFQKEIYSNSGSEIKVYINGGFQTRAVFNFTYYITKDIPPSGRQYMNTPQKTLLEFLPFFQLGFSHTTANQKFIFGANAGVAKNVYPVVWKLEPLVDLYCGWSIRGGRKNISH